MADPGGGGELREPACFCREGCVGDGTNVEEGTEEEEANDRQDGGGRDGADRPRTTKTRAHQDTT